MAEVSPWFAQALQYLDRDGSARVFEFETREEVIQFGNAETLFRVQGPSASLTIHSNLIEQSLHQGTRSAGSAGSADSAIVVLLKGDLFKTQDQEGELAIGMKHQDKPVSSGRSIIQTLTDFIQRYKKTNPKFASYDPTYDSQGSYGTDPEVDTLIRPDIPNPYINPDYFKKMHYYKYALVFGNPTEFNSSGVWVVEDFYNDAEELEY